MKFGWRWLASLGILGFLIPLILLEEYTNGVLFMKIMNSYSKEVVLSSYAVRNALSTIGIVIIIRNINDEEQYSMARSTIECYTKMYKYNLYIINMSIDSKTAKICQQKDIFFRRHCFVAEEMNNLKDDWLLFLDADVGVINPNHLIEEYLPPENNDVVFYRRIFNHEIMAGSYLIRNTDFSKKFLHFWANYEYSLPHSFHGSDNGAIHMVLLKFDALSQHRDEEEIEKCQKLWEKSTYYDSLSVFEVCVQDLIEKTPLKHIYIVPKGRFPWSRDGWLTNSMWSSKDFMFHGWQKRRQDKYIHGRWHNPLTVDQIDSTKCDIPATGVKNWRYKDSFITDDKNIDQWLSDKIYNIQQENLEIKQIHGI